MFDEKKLEAFLDSLGLNQVEVVPARTELDRKMDKYDIFKQPDYRNLGTPEFPIWGKSDPVSPLLSMLQLGYGPAMFPTYGGINRALYGMWNDAAAAPPIPSPYEKLKGKVRQLKTVAPAKIANPAPPTPAKSPDYVGTLTGWRDWKVEDGRLVALGTDFTWEPKVASRATCRRDGHNHPAPQKNCACGFWSFRTHDLAIQAMKGYAENVLVIGTVEIWGRVIECKNGYRSEFAYPKELWLLGDGLESLSWTYGVPVRKLDR